MLMMFDAPHFKNHQSLSTWDLNSTPASHHFLRLRSFTIHSLLIHSLFTIHSSLIHSSFTIYSSLIHPSFTIHTPSIHHKFISNSSSIQKPIQHSLPRSISQLIRHQPKREHSQWSVRFVAVGRSDVLSPEIIRP